MVFAEVASGFKQLTGIAAGVGACAFAYASFILCARCAWVYVAFVEMRGPTIAVNRRKGEPIGEVQVEVEVAVKGVRVVFAPIVLQFVEVVG